MCEYQLSSVAQSCPTFCDPMDCSTPGLPVHHQLLELVQPHVHRVSDAIEPSRPLSSLSPPAFNLSQHQGLFQWVSSASGGQSTGASASPTVFPMNSQGWFPLGLTGLISLQFKGLSRVFSSTRIQNHHYLALSLLYDSTLISIHDDCKNQSFDYSDLCWQNDVTAF